MSGQRLSDTQRLDWLQLIRCANIGPRTFRQLLGKFGGAGAALAALPGLIGAKTGAESIRIAERGEVEREIEASHRLGAVFIAMGEPDFPAALAEIDTCPPVLVVRGDLGVLQRGAISLVGSRNASAAGITFTARLARDFGRNGFVVVSGLARGIDEAAHRASLRSGTIAVLAGGHARIYPGEHEPLCDEIVAAGGAIVSEMPLSWEPRGRDFPRRNRIVSGLAQATVVVEAARKSGSLITARFALEQGREVFAVPGSPLDPRAEGANDLLREGAGLCTRPEDVTSVLAAAHTLRPQGDLFGESSAPEGEPLWDEAELFGRGQLEIPLSDPMSEMDEPTRPLRARGVGAASSQAISGDPPPPLDLLGLLGPSPVPMDDLVRASGRPAGEVMRAIFELELAGQVQRFGNGLVALRSR